MWLTIFITGGWAAYILCRPRHWRTDSESGRLAQLDLIVTTWTNGSFLSQLFVLACENVGKYTDILRSTRALVSRA